MVSGTFRRAHDNLGPRWLADGESRTRDLLITSQLLYQLSYIGTKAHPFIHRYAPCQRETLHRTSDSFHAIRPWKLR